MLNEELECEDRCGDSVIVNKPCDDGNTFNGDGCSKNCYLEFGFLCDKPPGQPCHEIIPPTFKVTAASKTNQHFIEFSEPVLLATDKTISPDNMDV
jgi:cysteine-rich repeat protein